MERSCLLCFITSLIILYLPFSWLVSVWLLVAFYVLLLIGVVAIVWRKFLSIGKTMLVIALTGLWCIATTTTLIKQNQMLHTLVGSSQSAKIQIEKVLHQGEYQTAIALLQFAPTQPNYRVYITWQADATLQAGQVWQGEITIKPIAARLNEGGFQRQKWLYANRIVGNANVKQAKLIADKPQLRGYLLRFAEQKLQGQSSVGLLLALGFGEKAYLSHSLLQLFQQTGTAHLIAISGLHIGLMMLLGLLLGRSLQYLLPTHWITPTFPLICGGILALSYSYLADFSVPTIRAITALALLLLLRFCRCYLNWWQLYLRTITILIVCDPLMLLSDSFWLSATAVFSLLVWHTLLPLSAWQWRGKPLSQLGKGRYYLLTLLHLQIGLTFLFTPIVLLFFDGFNLQSLLINLWIVPLFSFLLIPCILFSIFTFDLLHSWQWCAYLAENSIKWLSYFQDSWRDVTIREGQWLTILGLLFGLLLSCYALYLQRQLPTNNHNQLVAQLQVKKLTFHADLLASPKILQRAIIGFAIVLMWQIALLSYGYYQQWRTLWTLEMLDVGQGLAILLRQNDQGVLYDSGAAWSGGSMAELEILPYLRRQGVRLESLILSHNDNDHSGGAETLLRAYPNAQLFTSSQVMYAEKAPLACVQGKTWQWQRLRFTVLAPTAIVPIARNQHSCVLLIDDGNYRVLLTGDLDRSNELRYLANFPTVDILQVAHHGSKSSSSETFLSKVQAKVALISSGLANRWHFPHQEVLRRLAAQQMQIANTGWDGQIIIRFMRDGTYQIEKQRTALTIWFNQLQNGGLLEK
ncbi:competence protein [Gallibacterium salpingitidis]|uniref:Competence protein n=1 Tax=Gallibacterium salpingitidis TaxID=505341 RepID=A0A1A7NS00_9PAST|nr:competence protein [Gallibacterium salpingitidis]